jgi:hypothetical protein
VQRNEVADGTPRHLGQDDWAFVIGAHERIAHSTLAASERPDGMAPVLAESLTRNRHSGPPARFLQDEVNSRG